MANHVRTQLVPDALGMAMYRVKGGKSKRKTVREIGVTSSLPVGFRYTGYALEQGLQSFAIRPLGQPDLHQTGSPDTPAQISM